MEAVVVVHNEGVPAGTQLPHALRGKSRTVVALPHADGQEDVFHLPRALSLIGEPRLNLAEFGKGSIIIDDEHRKVLSPTPVRWTGEKKKRHLALVSAGRILSREGRRFRQVCVRFRIVSDGSGEKLRVEKDERLIASLDGLDSWVRDLLACGKPGSKPRTQRRSRRPRM